MIIKRWARKNWPGGRPGALNLEPIPVDGSTRIFVRLHAKGGSLVVLYAPDNAPENRAWLKIGEHLAALGLPVAKVLAADEEAGLFLMDDLGDASLQRAVRSVGYDPGAQAMLYEPVLAMLARLQAKGAKGFDTSLCFDGAELTGDFLRQREAGYFLEQFVQKACKLETLPAGLEQELDQICTLAGQAQPRGLVHRDYQSRNILIRRGGLGLVDFQGARMGPAQYDVAALINDPYVDLDWDLRQKLLEMYLGLLQEQGPLDRAAFMAGWPPVALSRCMQALGAYAFLTMTRGRTNFWNYVPPALNTMGRLLEMPQLADFTLLKQLAATLNPPEEL